MKSGIYLLFLLACILIISGCSENMEPVPREVNFVSFYPSEGATNIEPFVSFYWGSEYAVKFDLYVGTDPEALEKIASNITTPDFYYEPLFLSSTYYWQVNAYNIADEEFLSSLMSFSTREPVWQELYPSNGMSDLPLDIYFSWNLRSKELEDVTYSFYLGETASAMNLVARDLTEPYYIVNSLLYGQKYYWSVSMHNSEELLTSSAVYHFTTREQEWQVIAPYDGAINIETTVILQWQNDVQRSLISSATKDFIYDIYIGNSPDSLEIAGSALEESEFEVSGLDYLEEYFWKVKALYQGIQTLESEIYSFRVRDRFSNLHPAHKEVHVEIDPVLSWECEEAVSYDVYFGINEDQLDQITFGLTENSWQIYDLEYVEEYYWRIDAHLDDNSIYSSPIMLFATTIDPVPPGYKLKSYLVRADLPSNIDVVYRVTDMANNPITTFNDQDFLFLEDNEEIDPVESLLEIYVGDEINSTNKTVLMIDNSVSMDTLLTNIKLAAYDFIDNLLPNQEMCVYAFSETAELKQEFTKNKSDLIVAVDDIESGYASTDLYGSFITGVEHWEDFYYPENLIKGNLILITDGSDTQSSTTLEEALEARGKHLVYTIGIGSNVDSHALRELANQRYFHLDTADQSNETFSVIQNELLAYLQSFYWLNYITPKRGNFDHDIEISLNNNSNYSESSIISDTFNSDHFFGILPGVFVNVDPENDLAYGIEEYTIADSALHSMEAVTYGAEFTPEYSWEVEDPLVVQLLFATNNGNIITFRAGDNNGTTVLTVTDIANDHTRNIDITTELESRE